MCFVEMRREGAEENMMAIVEIDTTLWGEGPDVQTDRMFRQCAILLEYLTEAHKNGTVMRVGPQDVAGLSSLLVYARGMGQSPADSFDGWPPVLKASVAETAARFLGQPYGRATMDVFVAALVGEVERLKYHRRVDSNIRVDHTRGDTIVMFVDPTGTLQPAWVRMS
jgi:hypothetical protein